VSDLEEVQFLAGGAAAAPEEEIEHTGDAVDHASRVIGERAARRIGPELTEHLRNAGVSEFVVFGGACLRGAPADIDLAPAEGKRAAFVQLAEKLKAEPTAQYGKLEADGVPVQLCLVDDQPLRTFIESFDFAHCKVGVRLAWQKRKWVPKEAYLGPEFLAAMLTQGTFYTGGRWPLRSLTRTAKVAEKLELSTDECHVLAMQVVKHIYTKGLDQTVKADQAYLSFLGVPDTAKAAPGEEGGPAEAAGLDRILGR
jgi:hypothetical protein